MGYNTLMDLIAIREEAINEKPEIIIEGVNDQPRKRLRLKKSVRRVLNAIETTIIIAVGIWLMVTAFLAWFRFIEL